MIDYIKDMFVIGSKITTFPYTLKGPIAIVAKTNNHTRIRCPAGDGKKQLLRLISNMFMFSLTAWEELMCLMKTETKLKKSA